MTNIGAPPSIGHDNKGSDRGRKCDSVRHKRHHDVRELLRRIRKWPTAPSDPPHKSEFSY
jgi:hypothetical protein